MITRPISRSISRGIALAINDPNGAGFNPLSLFAAGEQGVWYDPSDLSTLFQDAAGTIPVTAAGQPVGMMRDKSGRGNHATQATATSRPILQTDAGKWYLVFDGVDDWMVTGNVDFTTAATNKMTLGAGVTKLSDVTSGANAIVCELSATSASNAGSFKMAAPNSNGAGDYSIGSRGTTTVNVFRPGFPAPHTAVLLGIADISAPIAELRVNKTTAAPVITTQGTGNYLTYPIYIGRRAGTGPAFNGNLYSLIVRGAASSAQQITDTETYINSKTGAY